MTTTAGTPAQHPWEPALSVRQVLGLERVLAGQPEVVAGAHRLDRPVRWVHVAEAADVGVMLSGGEMVLTTGVLLAGDEDKQGEYIRSLDRAEASAVVLGLGRAFPAPPDVMRRAAERCGLPLVVLHRPFPFAELTEEVQSRLLRRKFAAVSLSEAVRTELTGLITAGAPVQRLLDEVARHAGCPVVVTNLAHRVLATAGERAAVDDVLRDWERIARQAGQTGAGPADGWIRAELSCRGERWGRLVLCGDRGERATGRLLADRAAEALVLHRMLAGDGTRGGTAPGAAGAAGAAGSRGSWKSWDSWDTSDSWDSWEEQSARSLLTDLVSGAVPARQLLPRARAAGLPVNRRVFVPLVVGARDTARPARILRLLGLPAIAAGLADGRVAVLLSLAPDQDARSLTAHFAARLRAEPDAAHTVVAAADARTDWSDVPAGLREAQQVADAVAGSAAALGLPPVVRLRDVHLRGLVRLLRDDPHVQSFAERELDGLLRGPDRDLLPVLRTYLATGRNKSRTARLHHVSRPALYRRIEAIQDRLGVDLDDFEQAASVHIALLAHDAQQG
ncbi:PucR family transcriptional regulator [Streptomyces olivaceus]|uniref:PucR family transcriptional regulator n=1 Tax=Streptomyces olivaceus TaxID=47716 RepID=UPI0036B69B30